MTSVPRSGRSRISAGQPKQIFQQALPVEAAGRFAEAQSMYATALKALPLKPSALRVNLLVAISRCELRQSNYAQALEVGYKALAEARQLEDPKLIGLAMQRVAAPYAGLKDLKQSLEYAKEAARLHAKYPSLFAHSLVNLSAVHVLLGDFELASREASRALRIALKTRELAAAVKARIYLAELAMRAGKFKPAIAHAVAALELSEETREVFLRAKSLYTLGLCCAANNDDERAEAVLLDARKLFQLISDRGSEQSVIEALASVYERRGQFKRSSELYKVALALERSQAEQHHVTGQLEVTNETPSLVDRLGSKYPALTLSELRVCELLAERLSSKEMSRTLGISPATIERHRFNIRKKLGLKRTESLHAVLATK